MPIEQVGNEIRARIKNPDSFQENSFRTIDIDKKRGISAIIGKLKGETSTTIQAYRFDVDKDWTISRARKWLKDRNIKVLGERKV